jgi:hypothetical protein
MHRADDKPAEAGGTWIAWDNGISLLFCSSFKTTPERMVLDFDDTSDAFRGGQQLALFNAHYDDYCFQPIHIFDAATGKL